MSPAKRKHKVSDLNQIWAFSIDFYKSPQYQNSVKSIQWKRPCYVWTETVDMMQLIGDFHKYSNCLKSLLIAKFEVIIAMSMRRAFFCDVTTHNLLKIYRRFRETKLGFWSWRQIHTISKLLSECKASHCRGLISLFSL